ncbi:MAG: response regulator [Bacteroidetes bacterium]|nr:response regulator [Bacteroidota bacterium]
MLRKITFLIMDAEKSSCEEMQEFLQTKKAIVYTAHSAAEGQIMLNSKGIDILILDIFLPDADGLILVNEYKTRYPELEVILISGQGNMNSVIQAMHLGALDFLIKPLRQSDLQGAIERTKKFRIEDKASFLMDVSTPHPDLTLTTYHRRKLLIPHSENHFRRSSYLK